jgi:hypothetical protein
VQADTEWPTPILRLDCWLFDARKLHGPCSARRPLLLAKEFSQASIDPGSSGERALCWGATLRAASSLNNEVLRGFEPRSLDSESRVLTVTP